MANFLYHPPDAFRLIKGLFILLASIVAGILILFFALSVQQSVAGNKGEIIAMNSPMAYRAPFDGNILRIHVAQGERVSKGDTLVILRNELLHATYDKDKGDYFLLLKNVGLQKEQIEKLEAKIEQMKSRSAILQAQLYGKRKTLDAELSGLANQIKVTEAQMSISEGRTGKDKDLYQSGAISEREYETGQQATLSQANALAAQQKDYKMKEAAKRSLQNDYQVELQSLQVALLSEEQNLITLKKAYFQEEANLSMVESKMNYGIAEIRKQCVIAETDGYVNYVFGEKQLANIVNKGTLLVTIRPLEEERFYARLQVPQDGVMKITEGMPVHLKLDAYNHYQYGILEGTVKQVARQDTSQQFMVLIELPKETPNFTLRSGYAVKGDIVVGRIRLYRFMAERLFKV